MRRHGAPSSETARDLPRDRQSPEWSRHGGATQAPSPPVRPCVLITARPRTSGGWRRGRDSNPRTFRSTVFKTAAINRSATSPGLEHSPTLELGDRAQSSAYPLLPMAQTRSRNPTVAERQNSEIDSWEKAEAVRESMTYLVTSL